jgi:formylmethanofuran dehydrogenase subunit E
METVDFFDKHLDPPDYPTHSECDGCGDIFDNDDLNQFYNRWFCDVCLKNIKLSLENEKYE